MSRIETTFTTLQLESRKALIPFFVAGDPSIEATLPVMHAAVRAGANLIELGFPFSDPFADGPVIQRSSERALQRGVNLNFVFKVVAEFRKENTKTPIILMGYLNPIEMMGMNKFATTAAAAGVDGVILVDMPVEELDILHAAFNPVGLCCIQFISPTTPPERAERLLRQAQGFIYFVTIAGVTGGNLDVASVEARLKALHTKSSIPIVAGFGVKDGQSACHLAANSSGVVIGSGLVNAISSATTPQQASEATFTFLHAIRSALDMR